MSVILLDGNSLSPEVLISQLGSGRSQIDLTAEAWERVVRSRAVVEEMLESKTVAYGINTGFGNFANVIIPPEKLELLQRNLILSHSAGVGTPLTIPQTRCMMALRINVLAKGYSGVSVEVLKTYIRAYNAGLFSVIPQQGSVGASGDLAPLAHLALGLLGQGLMWDPETCQPLPACEVLQKHAFAPMKLYPKDGLALINGTQFISSLLAEALVRAEVAMRTANCISALTLEVLRGSHRPFLPCIQAARPHPGQRDVAADILALHTYGSESSIHASNTHCAKVQDAYSLRCIPQVHGIALDTLRFVRQFLTTELNSATDNPMIFPDNDVKILSGGNFHGEYPAKLADFLAIGIHEVANISVTRIERLMNPHMSGLPAFLVAEGGINSGFMIAHCTAAALVSENKTLCHPASVDSIPTSAGQEDHVSMGAWGARKALSVVSNVERVLAIELQAACQALDILRPLRSTEPLEKLYETVRSVVPYYESDQMFSQDIEKVTELIKTGACWKAVEPYLSH